MLVNFDESVAIVPQMLPLEVVLQVLRYLLVAPLLRLIEARVSVIVLQGEVALLLHEVLNYIDVVVHSCADDGGV